MNLKTNSGQVFQNKHVLLETAIYPKYFQSLNTPQKYQKIKNTCEIVITS